MVLDAELRVVAATSAAEALLGGALPLGVSAPKLLCGEAVERPMAEALAAGRAVTTTIPRPLAGGGDRVVRVRTVPLPGTSTGAGARPTGWILLLDEAWASADSADAPVLFQGMWTRDPAMKRLFRLIEKVAAGSASVLVRGETGAGKELVARAVHTLSPRGQGPFSAINCAALPPTLLESELFGHVRGAFTGAVRDSLGTFRAASGGTLFLDEVAELPLELQAKLLRAVETRTVLPVGATEVVPIDVRLVSATHRSLRAEVSAGRFRADLMYRLRVVPLFLPPLRLRPGDVTLLAERAIDELNARGGRHIERISQGARALLEGHDWPGNVRELRNVLEYAYAIGEGPILVEADLPPELLSPEAQGSELSLSANRPPPEDAALRSTRDQAEATRIRRALERAGGHRDRAARSLGLSRSTLWRRMRELGLA
ncbi:MAG: sigma 54-interacting transcriptional regulator [Deltaproteobacteria bacterium]|nr:sigma 54-interacting transcriptional regulator [Deltaproteobacteria bacterium]